MPYNLLVCLTFTNISQYFVEHNFSSILVNKLQIIRDVTVRLLLCSVRFNTKKIGFGSKKTSIWLGSEKSWYICDIFIYYIYVIHIIYIMHVIRHIIYSLKIYKNKIIQRYYSLCSVKRRAILMSWSVCLSVCLSVRLFIRSHFSETLRHIVWNFIHHLNKNVGRNVPNFF